MDFYIDEDTTYNNIYTFKIYDSSGNPIATISKPWFLSVFSPSTIIINNSAGVEKLTIYFHYIRATLLTQAGGNADNVLDTGDYYKRMAAFDNSDGRLSCSARMGMATEMWL